MKGIVKKSRCQFWLIFLFPGLFSCPCASFASNLDLTLIVQNPLPTLQQNKPITSGVPIPRSLGLTDLTALRLLDGSGQPVAAQFTPLARWGGGPANVNAPVKWLLLDFQSDIPSLGTASYRLTNSAGQTPIYPTLQVVDGPGAITVDTGVAQFAINKADGTLSAPHLSAPLTGRALTPGGEIYTTSGPVTVSIRLGGPMRASIHVKGSYRNTSGTALCDYTSRYWFYAGLSSVRLFHTLENNNLCPLVEFAQLNCFDIGSGGSINIADLSLLLSTQLGESLAYRVGGQGTPLSGTLSGNLVLYQDSSGTDHWNKYTTMTDWEGAPLNAHPRMQSYVTFRGYRTTLDGVILESGNQAAGWLSVEGEDGAWTVGVYDFWQNFPKALRTDQAGRIEIGLFPDEFGPAGYGFNLRAGEHKTHDIFLIYSPSPLPQAKRPGFGGFFAKAPSQWYVASGAFGFTTLPNPTDWPEYEDFVRYQLETAPTYEAWMNWYPNLLAAIESTDFYGLFDYGDWPLDYEGYRVSPLNNKYDYDFGAWVQWARGEGQRWFSLAEAADRHFADIDILHNLHAPRHWGDGIAFGHSYHDEEGFINPHRNYGGANPDVAFGTKGMLLAYYLTGYEKAFEAAIELADCIEYRLRNDGNLCSYFPDCNGEGYALGEGLFGGGSRPAANSLSMVVAANRATGDPRYLAVADALVDWAQPDHQPYINGPTGEDRQMRPWMLNMYLQSLADYLEVRNEFNLPDTNNVRGYYLIFANWLHTYPWLDLAPIDTGARAAYPYEWWFDDRTGIPGDENDNDDPSVNNWLLLGADAMAYAYRLTGELQYMDWAARLFRAGIRDPWFEGDANTYDSTKETMNSITYGHTFLYEWKITHPRLPGDSNGNGQTTIDELQRAINQHLGVFPVEPCNDLNGDGRVTIDEIQQVINAFLGINP